MRQDMQGRRLGAPVEGFDADTNVFGVELGVLDKDVEIAVIVEDARVEQLELQAWPARRWFSSMSRR